MTNLYFEQYTGSELHILEMARLFENKGYEVTIVVYKKAYPLLNEIRNIKVIECRTEELDELYYDVIFVQHFPVFDFLCCKYKLQFRKLIVSKLSVISELEELPVCMPDADLILCVSEECANIVKKKIGNDNRIRIFKNCVSQEFFENYKGKNYLGHNYPKKACVISNHIPEELKQLKEILSKRDCQLEYIGMGNQPRLVNASVLLEYDLIITIGRTVQQCFAIGIPVYVYDYFGGPGYITQDNFEIAERNNYSGRGFSKISAKELADDIMSQYSMALTNLRKYYDIALEKYNYIKEFEIIYNELYSKKSEMRELNYYNSLEKARISLYSYVLPLMFKENQIAQIYFDIGDGFCEENSICWNVVENCKIHKSISVKGEIKRLRFDPCNKPCTYHIYELVVNGEVQVLEKENICFTNDPQVEIILSELYAENVLRIDIIFSYTLLQLEEISSRIINNTNIIEKLETENLELKTKNKNLLIENTQLKNKLALKENKK